MHNLIIFIDSGDTLIDESTQVYEGDEIVSAEFIPGGREFLLKLHQQGYTIALVADGKNKDFLNVYHQEELKNCFDAWVVSEVVGKQKPNAAMFETAIEALHLDEKDKRRIVMIGNNIKKDVKGANEFGITSIWFDWSPRYFHTVEHPSEQSCYTVRTYEDLYALVTELDKKAALGKALC
jgi:putative hydrolase of the HAD superfamily